MIAGFGSCRAVMPLAKTDAQHQAVADVFEDLLKQEKLLEAEILSHKALSTRASKPEAEVESRLHCKTLQAVSVSLGNMRYSRGPSA